MLPRTEGLLDLQVLANTHIVFVGQGSLGAKVYYELRYPFGRVDLIDFDILDADNPIRHPLGLPHVGMNKAAGMRLFMHSHYGVDPSNTYVWDDKVQNILDQIPVPDIIVVAVDNLEAKVFVNDYAVRNNVPTLFVGVYEKGSGGSIFVLPEPQEICWLCASMKHPAAESDPGATRDYGITLQESMEQTPALAWSVASIAADTAHLVIQIMNGEPVSPMIHEVFHRERHAFDVPEALYDAAGELVMFMPQLEVVDMFRLTPDGTMTLSHGTVKHAIEQSHNCQMHVKGPRKSYSLDEI